MSKQFSGRLMAGFSAVAMASALAPVADALVVRDDVTVEGSEEAADNPAYDGVVQIYMFQNNGAVTFNCTGSLINHRTVISAAHCFNDLPGAAYGTDRAGGDWTPIIAYGPDTFDALFGWLGASGDPLDEFVIDDRNGLTFATSVFLHPDGDTAVGGLDFPGADVALLALQDPLDQLPTYSMLFSPVEVGEHVVQVAYGSHGIGSTGDVGLDGKRQVGENLLGLIGSQNDFLRGAFRSPTAGFIPGADADQVMYHFDMDRPDRDVAECERTSFFFGNGTDLICNPGPFSPAITADGTSATSVNDSIDWFPDANNPDALPNEAATAGGDSGSAIFFDELGNDELVIGGVLSGGWNFVSPNGGYGDISYYQPLFLFHEFIAQQNPYKYVEGAAGDGLWSDASRWTQTLDPAYLIFDGEGNLINALPDGPEPGVTGGQEFRDGVVFDINITDPEIDPAAQVATSAGGSGGIEDTSAIATDTVALLDDRGSVTTLADTDFETSTVSNVVIDPATGFGKPVDTRDYRLIGTREPGETPELDTTCCGDVAPPSAAAGPGSTGFVPNNDDGIGFAASAQYFDVTLSNAGTTTVDMDVVIDKLTLDNIGANLVIGSDWVFESIIDTQIAMGVLDVQGEFISRDILNGGLITSTNGLGIIETDTLFNVGMLSAGLPTDEQFGLVIDGDLVLTSASTLLYEGTSLAVSGGTSLGGQVAFNAPGLTFGTTGTLIYSAGEVVGEFAGDVQGVRTVVFSQSPDTVTTPEGSLAVTAVNFEISAQTFSSFLTPGAMTGNGAAMVGLLDGERGNYDSLSNLYDSLDFLSADDAAVAIGGLVPDTAFSSPQLAQLGASSLPTHLDRRFGAIRAGGGGGTTVNNMASSFQVAALDDRSIFGLLDQAGDAGGSAATDSGINPISGDGKTGAFIEVSHSTGDADAGIDGADGDIDTTSMTIGIDREFTPGLTVGVYGHLTQGSADVTTGLGSSDSESLGVGAYAAAEVAGLNLAGYAGVSQRDFETARTVGFDLILGGGDADEVALGASVSKPMLLGDAARPVMFIPEARVDYTDISVDGYTEIGSQSALTIGDRDISSILVKVGADAHFYDLNEGGWLGFKPSLGARIVYDLDGERDTVAASFASAPTTEVILAGAKRDKEWAEVRGALNFASADTDVAAALFAEGTIGRDDLSYVTVGVNVKAKF
ncbi:MAG: autotransporter domain-containing protein [Pseudomonadota bacterium]